MPVGGSPSTAQPAWSAWPGQVWGESSERCRGKPQCPAGLVEENETCVAKCDEGMVRVEGGLSSKQIVVQSEKDCVDDQGTPHNYFGVYTRTAQ